MSVTLCMIVKNESHVIERCLASVKPFIDYWIIVDTGSTDDTEAKIAKALEGVPGELHNRPWVDFGTNRTEALRLTEGRADYALIIDADDVLVPDEGFVMPELTKPVYNLTVLDNTISYQRGHLCRTDMGFFYSGVLHEYLDSRTPAEAVHLKGLTYKRIVEGARSKDPLKYRRDAEVLRKALAKEPKNPRYAYYYAQSLQDAGDLKGAKAAYERRVEVGGWDEETFMALYKSAQLTHVLDYPAPSVVWAFLRAYQFRPSRIESLHKLCMFFRGRNEFANVYLFATQALRTTVTTDLLFVEHEVYDWRMLDEFALAAYYTGRHAEAKVAWEQILEKNIPDADRERTTKNLTFF